MSFSMLINDATKELLYSVNFDDIFYISSLYSIVLLIVYLPTSNRIHVHTLFTMTVYIELLTY